LKRETKGDSSLKKKTPVEGRGDKGEGKAGLFPLGTVAHAEKYKKKNY